MRAVKLTLAEVMQLLLDQLTKLKSADMNFLNNLFIKIFLGGMLSFLFW